MPRIKIDQADRLMSQYVRLRDKYCQRCGSPVKFNDKGMPISHQASHFWGRGKESTRFDPQNLTTLCGGCHFYLTAHPAEHRDWMLQRLGKKAYDLLQVRANTYQKKDRKMSLLYVKQLMKELNEAI